MTFRNDVCVFLLPAACQFGNNTSLASPVSTATMGQCTSRSKPPKVLIPDPAPDAQCTFTVKRQGAEEHVVHKGVSTDDRTKWLLFTRQFSGSGTSHDPQLENFNRKDVMAGGRHRTPHGEKLWQLHGVGSPNWSLRHTFRLPGDKLQLSELDKGLLAKSAGGWGGDSPRAPPPPWGGDTDYKNCGFATSGSEGTIADGVERRAAFSHWSLTASAQLSSDTREPGLVGSDAKTKTFHYHSLQLEMFACGTSLCLYTRDDGATGPTATKTSWRPEWSQQHADYIDDVQFRLLDAAGNVVKLFSGKNKGRFPFAVGTRVRHVTRGAGTVSDHMPDGSGRTSVAFDNGEVHRYKPKSTHKLEELSAKRQARPAVWSVGGDRREAPPPPVAPTSLLGVVTETVVGAVGGAWGGAVDGVVGVLGGAVDGVVDAIGTASGGKGGGGNDSGRGGARSWGEVGTAGWECPLFDVAQANPYAPLVVTTRHGVDPTLALAVAHLATSAFSPHAIKAQVRAQRPAFPSDPESLGKRKIFLSSLW